MIQTALEAGLRQTMNRLVRPLLHPAIPVALQRRLISKAYLTSIPPRGTRFEDIQAEGLSITRVCHSDNPHGVILYFHGGGYVIGSLESHHGFCSLMAAEAGINVIAVDYKRAPESPFPGPIADGLGAWNWVVEHQAELGIDNTRIGLGGDSAGGNLAAVLAMQSFKQVLSAELSARPAFQFLLYPWVDSTFTSDSIKRFGKGLLLTEKIMKMFRDNYLPNGVTDLVLATDPLAFSATSAIPDTFIVTAEYDVLRDEGLAFVEKLKKAKVNVTHRHLPDWQL